MACICGTLDVEYDEVGLAFMECDHIDLKPRPSRRYGGEGRGVDARASLPSKVWIDEQRNLRIPVSGVVNELLGTGEVSKDDMQISDVRSLA